MYPIPFVSPSLDWLAWLGLASLASAWLVSSAAATTTATTPEEAYIKIGYFCDGRGHAQGLTTGCGTGYIQFVNGPVGDRSGRCQVYRPVIAALLTKSWPQPGH